MLKLLVEHGAKLNLITDFGRFTALSFAACDLAKFQYLLDAGADPFAGALRTRAFPHTKSFEVAELLIKLGYDPAQRADDRFDVSGQLLSLGLTPTKSSSSCPSALEWAVRDLDLDWLSFFERHNIRFERVNWTPLMRKIVLGTAASVAEELAKGADLASRDTWRRTPLMIAVRSGNLEKAKLVFEASANFRPDAEEEAGLLNCAIESGSPEMLLWLIDIGLDVDLVVDSETLLMTAAESGNAEAVRILLAHGADALVENEFQMQAINKATNLEIVKLLVDAGADINKIDGTGMFLLKASVEARDFNFLKGLIELGADVRTNNFGFTALHQATNYDQPEMMKLLLAAGADPNQINRDIGQYRPLCYARSREAALILIEAGADASDINEFHETAADFHRETDFTDIFTRTKRERRH